MHWPPQAQRGLLGASDQGTYTHTHTLTAWCTSPHYKCGGEPVTGGLKLEWICPDSSFSELNCVAGKRMNARVNTVSWGDPSFMNWIGPSVLYNTFSHPSFLLSVIQSVSSCAMVMNCNSSGLPPLSKTNVVHPCWFITGMIMCCVISLYAHLDIRERENGGCLLY